MVEVGEVREPTTTELHRGRKAASFLRRHGPSLAVFLLAAGVAGLFMINFCHGVYQCGCRSLWNGAAESCNIHVEGVPHCPWCSYGQLAGYLPHLAVVMTQGMAAFWPRRLALWQRLVLALLLFPVVGGLVALAFGGYSGYWTH